jgi:hypothetical protein
VRSSSLARVVIASLGVSVVITLGCSDPPTAPSPRESFSVLSISPSEGPTALATTALIAGTGFQSGDTVIVDGSRVNATVLSATAISLAMPAHGAGKVDVTVSQPGQAPVKVPGGYTYTDVVSAPPVISELLPNIGSTGGGTPIAIIGAGFRPGLTVTFGGIVRQHWPYSTIIQTFTEAHAAGTVDVIVTNPDGQAASSKFTYASPDTFDFNGDWQGVATDWDGEVLAPFLLTIRDHSVVSASCGGSSLALDPPPVVADGQFRFVGRIDGKILSPKYASGSISMAPCSFPILYWSAEKK